MPPSSSSPEVSAPDSNDIHVDDNRPIALRKGTRQCTLYPMSQFVSDARIGNQMKAFISALSAETIPLNYQKAVLDSRWKQAMQDEMDALLSQQTWDLVDPQWMRTLLDANGYIPLSTTQMVQLKDTRPD